MNSLDHFSFTGKCLSNYTAPYFARIAADLPSPPSRREHCVDELARQLCRYLRMDMCADMRIDMRTDIRWGMAPRHRWGMAPRHRWGMAPRHR